MVININFKGGMYVEVRGQCQMPSPIAFNLISLIQELSLIMNLFNLAKTDGHGNPTCIHLLPALVTDALGLRTQVPHLRSKQFQSTHHLSSF